MKKCFKDWSQSIAQLEYFLQACSVTRGHAFKHGLRSLARHFMLLALVLVQKLIHFVEYDQENRFDMTETRSTRVMHITVRS